MNSNRPNPLCQLCSMVEISERHLKSKEHAEDLIKSLNGIIIHSAYHLPPAIEKNLIVYDEVTGFIRQVKTTADFIRDLRELLYLKQL